LLATLLVSALGWLPIAHAMMIGALVMVLTGCLSMDEAYRAVDWRAVFLVAGLLPVSIAMIQTGAADAMAGQLIGLLAPFGAYAVAGGLLLLTVALTQFMSGQVTGVVLAPVAISAAQTLGADPRALAMMVALGTSLTFITPTAHPVNVFVMGAGGYRAGDYPRVGVPLTIVLMAAILLLTPLVWPLR
jgi:di/tricarboxylate transporter